MLTIARRLGQVVVALCLLIIILAIAVHTPPLRRAALSRAIAILQDRLNIHLQAKRLDYNLLTLHVALSDVDLSSVTTPRVPFLHADTLTVDLPRSALYGRFSIDRVALENARVHIVRNRDGTTNLPPSRASTREPAPIPIGRIMIPRLAIEVSDEPDDVSYLLPALAVDVGSRTGVLRLLSPGLIRRGNERTEIKSLDGGVSFDGRAVRLENLMLTTTEASARVQGTIVVIAAKPRLDLQLRGTADVGRAARWGMSEPRPTGTVSFDGTAKGILSAPKLALQVESDALAWQRLMASNVKGAIDLDGKRLRVSDLKAGFAGGHVMVDADIAFEHDVIALTGSWTSLDAAALVRELAPRLTIRPSGRASGTVSMRGAGGELTRWNIAAQNQMVAGRAAPNQLPVSGTARLQTTDGTWRLTAMQRIAESPVRADIGGQLSRRQLASSSLRGQLIVEETDLARLLEVLATADIVRGPPAITGMLRADVDLSGTLDSPYFKIAALTQDVSAEGVKNLTADVSAMGSIQSLAVDAHVRQDPGNLVSLTGTVFPQERRLDVRAAGRLENPARLAELPIAGVVDLEFDGAGPFDAITGRGKVTIADLVYDQSRLGRLESTVELDSTTAHVNASLPDFNATGEARVALAAPHETAIDVQLAKADLARAVRDQKLPTPLVGLVSLTGHATGPLDDWRHGAATLDVSELDARAGDLPLRLISPAQATYGGGIARVTSFEATVGDTHVSLAGDLRVLDQAPDVAVSDALRATLTGDVAQALSAVRAVGLVDVPPVAGRGPLALLARVTGSAMEPLLAADLELGPGSLAFADWPEATNVLLRAHLAEEGTLKVDEAHGEWQGSRIVADGLLPIGMLEPYVPAALRHRLPPARGTAALNLKAELTQRALEPFVGAGTVAQLDGTANATLRLSASSLTPDAVEGELRLDSFALRASNLQLTQREPTLIVVKDGVVRVATWEWVGDGTMLEVRGNVRLKDEQVSIDAGGPIDLRLLSPFVRNAGLTTAGKLESLVSITGPLRDPQVAGQVALSSGEVRLADPRIVATDLNGSAVLSRTRGDLPALAGTVNGGPLTGRAHVEYGPNPLSIEFTAGIRNMALDFPEGLRSELNVDMTLKLSEDTTRHTVGGSLSGDVTVLRGSYREPLAVVNALLSRLRAGRVAAAAAVPGPETFAERLALNIRVITEEDISVDNNYGRLALGGDLRVIGTAAAPAVSGRATLRDGGQLFVGGNVFTIQSGAIDFTNPETIEPNMNIVARTRVSGRQIELSITGTPGNLRLEPKAVDAGEQLTTADLWSLLLTGRRLSEVGGDERRIVGEQVLGYVSGDILGAASRAVGIDTIRLGALNETALLLRSDPTILGTKVDPTSRLTFGQSIGERVDVTFSQNLRDGDSQTWVVDFQPGYQLVLRFVSDDQNLRTYQLGHEIEFGEATTEKAAPSPSGRKEARVTDITIDGNLVLPEERVRSRLRMTVGDRFEFEAWQRDRDRVEQFYRDEGYREARITARHTENAQGVSLSYDIDAGARTTIEVSGFRLPRKTIEAIEQAWNGSVFDGFLMDDATRIVRQALLDEGYLRAEVKVAVASDGEVKTLSITIVPGDRTTEFKVRIESKDEKLARDLERWLHERKLETLAWRDRPALENALTTEMRTRGYLRAQVTVGVPLFDGRVATLPVEVESGPIFRVSEIILEGARTLFDAATNAVGIEPGAPYDPAAADAARDRVAAAYRRDGFGQVRVTVRPDVNADKQQVALVFQIVEGPRQVLQEVSVVGIRGVDQDVVTRALRVKIGDPIGPDTWLQARTRIFETGLFRRVDLTVEPIGTAQANDATRPMRIQITVEEWPELRLRYGFALVEEHPAENVNGRELVPGVAADVTRRTLFGRPITVGAAFELQRRQELGRLFATTPTFFTLPIASSLTVQRSRQEFADATLITDLNGISWEQQFKFTRRLNLLYAYTFERNHTFDTAPVDPIFSTNVTVNVARLSATAAYDTRDNVIDTTRGFLLSSNFGYAPEIGGSDFRFVRHLGQAYYFRPWRGVVLASAARFGLANALAGQELIPSERFFAGGATSLRGIGQDRLGPQNVLGDPTGGEGLLLFNQEFRFPIYRWFRGVAFSDAGNVFLNASDVSLGKLRGSLGLGLRVATRFALLRVDYGRLLSPQTSQERSGIWTFGIGQIF